MRHIKLMKSVNLIFHEKASFWAFLCVPSCLPQKFGSKWPLKLLASKSWSDPPLALIQDRVRFLK